MERFRVHRAAQHLRHQHGVSAGAVLRNLIAGDDRWILSADEVSDYFADEVLIGCSQRARQRWSNHLGFSRRQ